MLNQINAGNEDLKKKSLILDLFNLPINLIQNFSQPITATFLVVFLFLTGGFVGLRASVDTRPGDSLYIAKIVGEKTQLALAFTDKKKAQLGIEFAVKRAAEIKQVIAEEDESIFKDDKVERLVNDFKKEISAVKLRIEKISKQSVVDEFVEDESVELELVFTEESEDPVVEEQDNESQVFSAGSNKTETGLQISASPESSESEVVAQTEEIIIDATDKASTTEEELIVEPASPESILEQAGELLQAEAYDEVFDVLLEANSAIDQTFDTGEVQGVEESVNVDEGDVELEVGTSTKE